MIKLTDNTTRQQIQDGTYCPKQGQFENIEMCNLCTYYRGKIKEGRNWNIVCAFANSYAKELKELDNEPKK